MKLQQSDDTPHEVADAETDIADDLETDDAPREVVNAVTYDSDDAVETDGPIDSEEDEESLPFGPLLKVTPRKSHVVLR